MNEKIIDQYLNDLQLRNLAPSSIEVYQKHIRKFAAFIDKPLSKTSADDAKRYLLHLRQDLKRSVSTQNQCAAAFRFFYIFTLNQPWLRDKIIIARNAQKIPDILSGSEVAKLIGALKSLKHKALAFVCYGAGLRVSEAIRLCADDIDSSRGVIIVRMGKGNKMRQVTMSPRLLKALRYWWVQGNLKGPYLFPGRKKDGHIGKEAFGRALQIAAKKAGIDKLVTPHVLRHSYATHLIESGANLRTVQLLLGHSSIRSTVRYVHLTHARMQKVRSPLDILGTPEGALLG